MTVPIRRCMPFLVFILTVTAIAQDPDAAGQSGRDAMPVSVQTSVTKTAIWVGDPITYIVELRCAPKVDILIDDLDADRLPLKGLELLGADTERDASAEDRITYRVHYRLVAYNPETAAVGVGPIPVRYHVRQPGIRPEDVVPAGEVNVPPLVLSLRSTIPEGSTAELRDERGIQPFPGWIRMARPIGLGLVALAIAPVAFWGAGLLLRARRARSGGRVRKSRKQLRAELDQIKALEVATPEALREAYARLDTWLRANLESTTGRPAHAVTPREQGPAHHPPPPAQQMHQGRNVLVECERAKYAPGVPSEDHWRTVLVQAEHSVGAEA